MIKVLDKGFIRLVDSMGDDSAIVQSARVSYGEGTRTLRDNEGLINYLVKNYHDSPLEMVSYKFHVKCPIFVARQIFRHRIGSFNEISARYSEMKKEFYIPTRERIKSQSKTNKQCSGDELPADIQAESVLMIEHASKRAYETYEHLIDSGVSREIARIVLPVNLYTEFYWGINLRSLLNFISLRSHPHAQEEIREYSKVLEGFVNQKTPIAFNAFKKFRINEIKT